MAVTRHNRNQHVIDQSRPVRLRSKHSSALSQNMACFGMSRYPATYRDGLWDFEEWTIIFETLRCWNQFSYFQQDFFFILLTPPKLVGRRAWWLTLICLACTPLLKYVCIDISYPWLSPTYFQEYLPSHSKYTLSNTIYPPNSTQHFQ